MITLRQIPLLLTAFTFSWALTMFVVAAVPVQGYTPPTQATGTANSPTFSGLTVTATVQSTVFAAPSGSAGSAAFRTLVAADIPGLMSTATLPTNIKSTLNPVSGTLGTFCTLAIPTNSGGSCEISATVVVTDGSNNQDVRNAGMTVVWRNKAGACAVAVVAFGSDNPTASSGSVSAVGLSASVSGAVVSLTCTPTWTTIAPSAGQVSICYTIKSLTSSVAGVTVTPQQ